MGGMVADDGCSAMGLLGVYENGGGGNFSCDSGCRHIADFEGKKPLILAYFADLAARRIEK